MSIIDPGISSEMENDLKTLSKVSSSYEAAPKYKKAKPHWLRSLLLTPLNWLFFFFLYTITAIFLCHILWMSFDVRLGAIRTFGIIHNFY